MSSLSRLSIGALVLFSIQAQAQYSPAPYYNYPQQAVSPWNNGSNFTPYQFKRSPWSNPMGSNMPWNNGFSGNNMPWPSNNFAGNSIPWIGNNNGNNNYFQNAIPQQFNGGNGLPMGNFNGPWNKGTNAFPTIKGPWNNGWGTAPWKKERWDDKPWGTPRKWFNFNDPKEGMAEMWEDGIKAPNKMGSMPGGWTAPSISVPNPVDVTDTFGKKWRDLPAEVSDQGDNFTYNIVEKPKKN